MREESGSKPTRASKDTNDKIGDASLQAQGEFFKALREMRRDGSARAATEVDLGFKLSKNLIAAHSLPDAVVAYGQWLSEEIDARAEDARRMMSHGQKFVDSRARLLPNGWMSYGTTI